MRALLSRAKPIVRRPELTVGEIHDSYYADSPISQDVLGRALEEISQDLGVPLGKVRPEDRFDVELGPSPGWQYDDDVADVMAQARDSRKGDRRRPV
jgi:hypothetical protein